MSVQADAARADRRDADAEVGRAVHMLMWDRQVKQAELASRLGIQQSALSKKLRGHRPWTVDELLTTAAFLQTSVGYLVGETREEAPMVHPLGLEPRTHCNSDDHVADVIDLWSGVSITDAGVGDAA